MFRVGILLFSTWCALVQAAIAQELTPRQQSIIAMAMATDGWMTEEMHREFWSAVPVAIRSDPRSLFKFTSPIFMPASDALRDQKEIWESVRLTLAAKRVTTTMGYGLMKFGKTPEQVAAAQRADALLAAAAAGTKVDGPKGPFYVTEALADATLAGWDGAHHRLRKLWALAWTSEVKEYDFPREHIKILWDGPFARETQRIFEGGRYIRTTMLTYRMSDSEHAAVGYMRLGGRWPDPRGAVMRTVSATLAGMGIPDVRPVVGEWRGRVSAEGNGSTRTSKGQLHASVRLVEAAEYKGAWQFIAISETSLPDAISLRERLEKASAFGASAQSVAWDGSPDQVFIECEFPTDPRAVADPGSPYSGAITDKDAKIWYDSPYFSNLSFIIQVNKGIIMDSPPVVFQHLSSVYVTPEEFSFAWYINGEPRERRPRVEIKINRSSGEAMETFVMDSATKTFIMDSRPHKVWEWHWIRKTQCEWNYILDKAHSRSHIRGS